MEEGGASRHETEGRRERLAPGVRRHGDTRSLAPGVRLHGNARGLALTQGKAVCVPCASTVKPVSIFSDFTTNDILVSIKVNASMTQLPMCCPCAINF